jgi:O-antigen/teichoic acid export membrane protein
MREVQKNAASCGWLTRQYKCARNWLNARLGIDKAIGFTILARGWGSLAGLITLALIVHFLSPTERGYYYTFGSLLALQILFELGFSFVILQMASHERAHLTISAAGNITGDPVAHARLASVLQKSIRWYTAAAVLLATLLLTVGSYLFSTSQHSGETVAWRFPWYAAALAATLTFQLDPILSFMEGCGFVHNVARLRLAQAMTGSLLAWLALATHHGLFAPSMIMSGNACVAFIWISHRRNLLLPLLKFKSGEHRIHWTSEVWHFQWRMAVSWLSGYFIFYLFNPVLLKYKGGVVAGQMGMSLALAGALQNVSISWINTKAAPFGALIARREFFALDTLFFRALRQSVAVCAVGAVCVWAIDVYLNLVHFSFALSILSPVSLGLMLLGTILNVFIFGEALYLRAHKQEKFLLISVLSAILTVSSTYFLGKRYGALGMVSGNLAIGLFMGLPMGTYTFFKYRRIWHE